jgi:hypothetical protein
MLFIDNKYSRWYNTIIKRAQTRTITGYVEKHHIIPKSLGGSNAKSNIVSLTAKEHFICHMLLPKMVDGIQRQKMIHAWWAMATLKKDCQDRYRLNSFQYESVRQEYSKYFSKNNPMNRVKQKNRMKLNNNNPYVRSLVINGLEFPTEASACRHFNTSAYLLRKNFNIQYVDDKNTQARKILFQDKFITPNGIFKTKKEIQKVVGIPEWTLNTIYNDLDAYPVTNGRASKKINHLNIDPTKTWRDNGFGLVAIP